MALPFMLHFPGVSTGYSRSTQEKLVTFVSSESNKDCLYAIFPCKISAGNFDLLGIYELCLFGANRIAKDPTYKESF